MRPLSKIIKDAEQRQTAIAHFNVATLEQMNVVARVASELRTPVVVGVSEGERKFMGLREVIALRDVYRKLGTEIYVNADHTRTLDGIEEAARAGCDSIIFDVAHLPLEENITNTKIAVNVVKKYSGFLREIIIEGELGYIGTSSQLLDAIPEGAAMTSDYFTTPEDARLFVKETGVALLAPAVGNIHGMLKNAQNPRLDISRITNIRKVTGVPLVLHGGSGVSDDDFISAINAGISLIHVSTELRVAWRSGLEESLKEMPNELAPYKILRKSVMNLEKTVKNRMRLFSKIS